MFPARWEHAHRGGMGKKRVVACLPYPHHPSAHVAALRPVEGFTRHCLLTSLRLYMLC